MNRIKFNIKEKLELSKVLENIEKGINEKKVASLLDKYHSKQNAHVLGITGPPGVGKSSMINRLIANLRNKSLSVGVLAIDPSSQKSGGALLGDRARFDIDPKDSHVFIRSMAAKDYLGGISELTYPYMTVMRSLFDMVIIETVGVGQSEISIEDVVDTVIYCVQPGSGDTIQFMKSGIIEIPDVVVVTKSDLKDLSQITLSDLLSSKNFLSEKSEWDIGILPISSKNNSGVNDLLNLIQKRWLWLNNNKILKNKRIFQDIEWIKRTIRNKFGTEGIKLIENQIKIEKNPFTLLKKLKNRLHLKFD